MGIAFLLPPISSERVRLKKMKCRTQPNAIQNAILYPMSASIPKIQTKTNFNAKKKSKYASNGVRVRPKLRKKMIGYWLKMTAIREWNPAYDDIQVGWVVV